MGIGDSVGVDSKILGSLIEALDKVNELLSIVMALLGVLLLNSFYHMLCLL